MRRYEKILETVNSMSTPDIVRLHNNYCYAANYFDDEVYLMEEFDEIMGDMKPWEVARAAYFGHDFNPARQYFTFNGYGNLESFDYWEDEHSNIDIEAIAEYIDSNEDALDNDDIQEIFDNDDQYEIEEE